MKPFFCYYGGKWRAAPKYPTPRYGKIVEPFAGAAGYSLRYADLKVDLYDTNGKVAALWRYLIKVSAAEILALPGTVAHIDDVHACDEAKYLIGFWLNKGMVSPCRVPSAWMRRGDRPNSFWGPAIRQRIADQVDDIRHWRIFEQSYETAPNEPATWFVDPPYASAAGEKYCQKFDQHAALGEWCQTRHGQVIVCEAEGADWLPFRPFLITKSLEGRHGKKKSREAIWEKSA